MNKPLQSNSLQSNSILENKVFWVSVFVIILIAVTFWTQSRVPALNEKAQIGERINISAIAFDVILPVDASQPLYERTYKAAANWAYTNWKGMTFGFLLAAAFISLLQSLPKSLGGKNRYLNSLLGLSIGSPLGVCVNCATPIAQGMIHAGARLETSLSMLLSSPTLNPIVLSIAFSVFAFHVAAIKVLFSVFFILLLVPFLIRLAGVSSVSSESISEIEGQVDKKQTTRLKSANDTSLSAQSWSEALSCTAASFFKNLLYIVKITFPLMIVAGLLGSLLIEALPVGSLSELTMQPLTLLAAAVIGVFLPVPIAFDVLIVNVLISAGLNIGLAATLLFSLGIFSIYPALIIARTVSVKLCLLFALGVVLVAMFVGVVTNAVDKNISDSAKVSVEKALGGQLENQHEKLQAKPLEAGDENSRFQEVIDICGSFNDVYNKAKCLQKVFLSNVFLNAGTDICPSSSAVNQSEDYKQIGNICRQAFSFLTIKKSAITKNDINVCQSLTVESLADECMLNYIRVDSLSYSSLDACLQLKDSQRQRYCGYMIISDRMMLKTKEACELNLFADMKRQCLDNLNAHIASEFGELEKCEGLESDNAKNICRSTVTTLKISRLQDYSICEKSKTAKERHVCKDQVLMHRAENEGDSSLCALLVNSQMSEACKMNVVIRKKQAEIESHKFSSFNNTVDKVDHSLAAAPVLNKDVKQKVVKALVWSEIYNDKSASLAYTEHFKRNAQSGKMFKQVSAAQLGIDATWDFDLTDFMEPFVYGKGVASGDYNNDSWPDLAFASSNGLHLYKNKGDGTFEHAQHITLSQQALNAFVVSFIDIDNDGWQDLFLTAYGSGSYFFKNEKGRYADKAFVQLKNNKTVVSLAAGFSDWDKDGYLDVILGNWSYGAEGAFIPEKSQNVWYNNEKLKFKSNFPKEALGETLSILLSDINSDGYVDLIVGNDRKYPDIFYFSQAGGNFNQLTKDMGIIKQTSFNTMSYDSADFNNDLRLDVFSIDMFMKAGISRNYCDAFSQTSDKKHCEWLLQASKSVESLNVGWCDSLENKKRTQCYTAIAIRLAKRYKDTDLCDKVSSSFPAKANFCRNISRKIKEVKPASNNNLAQHEGNKLLINTVQGKFIDATESMGVSNSFWGWSGKAADLDNDGWQDIYIGNGFHFGQNNKDIHSNIFYHNQQGKKFIQAEEKFGLTNYANTPSYTYVDFDLDGDIDIISSSVMLPPAVFVNQGATNNSLSFVLRDNSANKFCIGCKIIISYDTGKKNQVREIKLSGGFMSYDAPVAHFGVGDFDHIDAVKVIWSTGETWQFDKKLLVNRRYKITRQAGAQ
ncbi:hypothetical protein MNBD_GAMMA06-1893 [hydrothermal vent metagenome]|uniref:ASPIC/UnbV domain-containing protein n=1 Tax=hydrothermal vent metagenome TaxID=652676 RepID=A0A3B0W5U9_9ZZZZ